MKKQFLFILLSMLLLACNSQSSLESSSKSSFSAQEITNSNIDISSSSEYISSSTDKTSSLISESQLTSETSNNTNVTSYSIESGNWDDPIIIC